MNKKIVIPQEEDTFPTNINMANYAYRYAYIRSTDSRTYEDPGQDYLVFVPEEQSFTFALCDGVSQSFFGNLGAQFLGEKLVQWLLSNELVFERGRLQASLSNYLVDLTRESEQRIEQYVLPESVPSMLKDVLEKKRGHGSESTFVCGRIDFPSSDFLNGRVFFAWMGDSRLRFWRDNIESTDELVGEFNTRQRWSTKKGPIGGDPNVFISDLGKIQDNSCITKVLTYSDGIAGIDDKESYVPQRMLIDIMTRAMESPTSDDISYLEIYLNNDDLFIEKNQDDDITADLNKRLTPASFDVPTKPRFYRDT